MDNSDRANPVPWVSECHRNERRPGGINRSAINAADGTQVASGMNNAKAEFITHRVNCHDELLGMLKLARECIAYCRRAHKDAQSGEGVPVEVFIDEVIAKAEGR